MNCTIYIPTMTMVTKMGTAEFFLRQVISRFGIPRRATTDRNTQWKGDFQKGVYSLMSIRGIFTTSYHPQADGRTKVLNPSPGTSLHAYIGPCQDNWTSKLDGLTHDYRIFHGLSATQVFPNYQFSTAPLSQTD
jgi:hypothetical protein